LSAPFLLDNPLWSKTASALFRYLTFTLVMQPEINRAEMTDDGKTVWSIEAWRGLAAWLVVYAHYRPFVSPDVTLLSFSFTGVDLFFVLSGFLFAPHLFGRPLALREFATRRFFRIYPAYFLALGIYVCLKAIAFDELPYVWQHLFFAHLQTREMAFFYNPAFWSLPAEVEFYLLLPLLAIFTRSQIGRFAVLVVAAWVMRAALGYASDSPNENRAYVWMYHLPGMLLEFMLGGVAWLIARHLSNWKAKALLFMLGLVGWLVLAGVFVKLGDKGIDATWARGQISWLAAMAFAAMVAATARLPEQVPYATRFIAIWAGRLSYGTYLLHFAALQIVKQLVPAMAPLTLALLACTLTIAASWLMYRFWENPWREFGRATVRRLPISPV
jgi:peptidoglycan/LPS O-acetylase OafA/YrhL